MPALTSTVVPNLDSVLGVRGVRRADPHTEPRYPFTPFPCGDGREVVHPQSQHTLACTSSACGFYKNPLIGTPRLSLAAHDFPISSYWLLAPSLPIKGTIHLPVRMRAQRVEVSPGRRTAPHPELRCSRRSERSSPEGHPLFMSNAS